MYRRFIAIVLCSAIAVTGLTTQPARAGNDDIAKFIAGAAALAIIGAAIADRNDDKVKRNHSTYLHKPNYGHAPQKRYYGYGQPIYPKAHRKPHRNKGRYVTPYRNAYALPAQCREQRYLHGNPIRGFSPNCLQRYNVNVANLPRDCAVRFRDRDRRHVLFTGRCLHQYGYSVARY